MSKNFIENMWERKWLEMSKKWQKCHKHICCMLLQKIFSDQFTKSRQKFSARTAKKKQVEVLAAPNQIRP